MPIGLLTVRVPVLLGSALHNTLCSYLSKIGFLGQIWWIVMGNRSRKLNSQMSCHAPEIAQLLTACNVYCEGLTPNRTHTRRANHQATRCSSRLKRDVHMSGCIKTGY
jgi:hypothetical protein